MGGRFRASTIGARLHQSGHVPGYFPALLLMDPGPGGQENPSVSLLRRGRSLVQHGGPPAECPYQKVR
ncbi:hypothetical protein CENSYa_0150 [Cenarchaeum symbiosum A]|uniref:Uncharacterized protein n=1 Tax=Cenarchaeum symbiosum (strain A) TaxID=414004 RepID=A0RTX8_CENSY|nr:hypothetical protein CENSYa_0150 [Cenarchaeum symbiosum A]